ncbi:phage major capsid protein [Azospirillum argentinense]|uniref:Phage major capsid protein n=1 Tax=Azospirillum argentinense TaxID=2970906 RepID=A0ABW8V4Y9_9PROT
MEVTEIKGAVDGLMTAFEEFKATNDARLSEIEKKGSADTLVNDKLARIEQTLSGFEGLNQRLTHAELKAKQAADGVDAVETKLGRMGGSKKSADGAEIKARVNDWARAVVAAHTVGVVNLSEDQRRALSDTQAEYKSLNVSNDTAGGYLAPIEYVREIIKGVTEVTPFRAAARVRQTVNKSIQLPRRTGQFAATWTAEQGTRSETTGLAYGMDEMPTHEMYALIDISQQMLEDGAFDMESEIRMEAEEQFSVAEGSAFISGSGVGKPQGILSNTSVGTVNSGSSSALTADGLISLFYGIKTAYARNGIWMMNRGTIAAIRKLKDSQNQYLWQPGLAGGVPNTILGASYVEAPDMPDVASGAKPIAFGDFRRGYTICDRIAMEMLRDPYTQATSGNIRFIFRRRVGGQVTLAEAFKTQTVAS